MRCFRLSSVSLASCLAASLIACGGGDDGDGGTTPTGEHYKFVVDGANVPSSNTEVNMYGLDLDGDLPDGDSNVDNQLGSVLAFLGSQGFDAGEAVTEAINDGSIAILADLQTPSFSSAAGAGLQIRLGDSATIMPTPCDTAMPPVCGAHLMGTGMFTLAAGSPTDAIVTGSIVSGVFNGGPGKLALQIALTGAPININLIGAKARLSGMSADAITTGIVAGAIPKTEVDTMLIPAVATQINGLVQSDCTPPLTPPACGCADGSGARLAIQLLDKAPVDCMVTGQEILENEALSAFFAADVTIEGTPALSLGLGVSAVKATF